MLRMQYLDVRKKRSPNSFEEDIDRALISFHRLRGGFQVGGLGFRVLGVLGFRVLGFRVWGLRALGFRVGFRLRVSEFRVHALEALALAADNPRGSDLEQASGDSAFCLFGVEGFVKTHQPGRFCTFGVPQSIATLTFLTCVAFLGVLKSKGFDIATSGQMICMSCKLGTFTQFQSG